MTETIEIVLRGTIPGGQQRTYLNVPFDMPEHVTRLDVRYEYSDRVGSDPHLTNGNTVDIGIFDARGAGFLSDGFRGWSGSARDHFYIAQDSATAGYLFGPIQPGQWTIILGLYKIWDKGCDYEVNITLTAAPTAERRTTFPAMLPLRDEPTRPPSPAGWYRGDLHCHSVHSDGDAEVEELLSMAQERGLDYLAVTDHNNITHQAALESIKSEVMMIPGIEVTTYFGHWNIWGDQGWIDFRVQSTEDMQQAITEAVDRGYLVSCNHPRPAGPDWEFREAEGYHCVEIYNGPWQFGNHHCLAYWESLLRQGKRLVAVGGSDTHFLHKDFYPRLGYPTTFIHCEENPTPRKLIDSLRAGHAFVTHSPDGPQLYLTAQGRMMGDTINISGQNSVEVSFKTIGAQGLRLQFVGADGILIDEILPDDAASGARTVNVNTGTLFIYARLIDDDPDELFVHTVTNPLYLE